MMFYVGKKHIRVLLMALSMVKSAALDAKISTESMYDGMDPETCYDTALNMEIKLRSAYGRLFSDG